FAQTATHPSPSVSTPTQNDQGPRCQASPGKAISIACNYTPLPAASSEEPSSPKIALDRAQLSIGNGDGQTSTIRLRFTNIDFARVAESRIVYIQIDDEAGRNYVRRPLSSVKLDAIAPGQSLDFSQTYLFPAFEPGSYIVRLWIPSSDPKSKFDASKNW